MRAAAIRQRQMRSESDGHLAAAVVPRPRGARVAAHAVAQAAGRDGREPVPPERRRLPRARRGRARAHRLEPELHASGGSSAIRAVDGGLRARRRRAVRARARRDRASGSRAPERAARRRPRLRAARVRVPRRDRRCRDGGGDRVAERAGRRRRGRLDPAPRAAPPAAERAAPVLLEARARRVSRPQQRAARGEAARAVARRPFRPGPRGTSRSRRPSARDASASSSSRTAPSR